MGKKPLKKVVLLLLSLVLVAPQLLSAQDFFIGMKGGANFTSALVSGNHSVFNYTSQSKVPEGFDRKYDGQFDGKIGTQFGFLVQMETRSGLGFSFEPSYATYKFGYENSYSWQHPELADQFVEMTFRHDHRLNYMELPLFVKFNFLKGVVSPYIQGGGFYNFLIDAGKTVTQTRMDAAAGGLQELTGDNNEVGITNLLHDNTFGLAASGGISINTAFVRISLECSYRHFMKNITNPNARYSDARSSMLSFDVMDDISFQSLQFSMTALFPLSFMHTPGNGSKGKKTVVPYDMRRMK
ncbi:hypothetical protein R9C00_25765 [Flammeovirgaceae bacterium SG7u.111]|nr:hypothetical protein [Flammeovirgaceae bacterium SG7u.132]WPO35105.1 hypothetical protein R9C00_25765 [Flammeovirgaceae bacterium SG7u.111]